MPPDAPEGGDRDALIAAIAKAGYVATPLSAKTEATAERKDAERRALMRDVMVALILTLPVFVLEMGSHMIPGMHELVAGTIGMQASWYLQFGLTTLVLFIPGIRFYEKGLPALWRLAPDMNSLVAVGSLAAYGYSMAATFAPGLLPEGTVNVYYEAAAVIVTLILLGRLLEARAKGHISEAIRRLVGLQARTARVRRDGWVQDAPIEAVVTGDVIEVRPGNASPWTGG